MLSFSYAGPLEGILLYVQEEVIHFSLYNGWYPMGFDADTAFDVTVHMDDTWELVNGSWDPAAGVWRYHAADPMPPDCNILLIDRAVGHLLRSGGLRLWYFAPEHEAHARLLTDEYTAVAAFYRDLYGHGGGLAETNLVVMPPKYQMGAYQREKLTVFSSLGEDPAGVIANLAHELGHAYANGADAECWEDWLNETHAEWSALLYMQKRHPDYFARRVEAMEGVSGELRLRTPSGERPGNVHETGTILYCRLFRKYGADAIADLLRAFDRLEVKDTAHFLEAVSMKRPEIAREIREHC